VPHASASASRAFTLVEMVVVIAIVLIILGLVLPAAGTLWKERIASQADTMLQGMLMTARAKAMRANGVETGFLAHVDEEGVQHLTPIEQGDPLEQAKLFEPPESPTNWAVWAAWQNVFVISEERDRVLPLPMRVVPRYVVEDSNTRPNAEDFDLFSEEELANDDFYDSPDDQAQRHRNFFTMVFSTDGQLRVGRDVLIQDPDADAPPNANPSDPRFGDRTGLRVGPGPPAPALAPYTEKFYAQNNIATPIDPRDTVPPSDLQYLPGFLVIDGTGTAINFPSVDGLLVYDDSLLGGLSASEKREFLLRAAQPLYVSRWTGTVVRGPVGEMP
jgi:prepilin-type N-terminal cleavage/methylation domain-containing protein